MTLDKRIRNTIYSVLIFASLSGLVFIIPWDSDFAGLGIFLITELVGLFMAGLLILLRVMNAGVKKTGLLYNYFGTLNLLLGLILLISSLKTAGWGRPVLTSLNLIVGIGIIVDIYRPVKTSKLKA